ncbi:universal stress protein UspA-like protein [Desulfosporosinus orientis DSM 765]|uniref:Universal stress protein UspA-like protein n=1 Tax=Desulfosporosinus orientis (strain ATCC 19365 / DSM 765 / NCIMB 8382 / VKM B-1628 / Singapore I) TaxID=768706 RepID=G7W6Z4_DESOD|nr:universal stress protein [Desulfosporosinus orientis]AET69851.1 universal stress protein UspA-like protein [Desulfosporosinus orientis DSM 765]
MNASKFKVLLYSDGSHQAFSAAVYTTMLLTKMANMHLTIVQVHEADGASLGTEYSSKELRPRYKRYSWGCSKGNVYSWIDTWPVSPTSDWVKRVLEEGDSDIRKQYSEILSKTNKIFSNKGLNVKLEELYTDYSISDTSDISQIADIILDYATKGSFELIIMGTRGPSTLNRLIFGSLAYTVLNKSPMPVLLIKKLPQDFIYSYLARH